VAAVGRCAVRGLGSCRLQLPHHLQFPAAAAVLLELPLAGREGVAAVDRTVGVVRGERLHADHHPVVVAGELELQDEDGAGTAVLVLHGRLELDAADLIHDPHRHL